jgi:hypothetical protein
MIRAVTLFAFFASVAAFAPVARVARGSALKMGAEDLIGATAPAGFFDPLGLSKGKDDETLAFYRSAELKHGRVSMVATLGVLFQSLDTGIIPNPSFHETNMYSAVKKVYFENPSAFVQILLAISAVEVLCASIESKERPGDFGWDPANIRPTDAEKLDELQTKEINNGRLAMMGIAGLAAQVAATGQGTIF